MRDLPVDIIYCIAQAVLELPLASRAATLRSLSLVAKAWRSPAQQALYSSPFFPSTSDAVSKFHTYSRMRTLHFSLAARADLALAVRSLPLGSWTTRTKAEARIDRRLVSDLSLLILQLCPNLTHLDYPGVTHADANELHLTLAKLERIESFSYGDGVAGEEPWIINYNPDIRAVWGTAPLYFDELAKLVDAPSQEPRAQAPWHGLKHLTLRARLRSRHRDDTTSLSCRLHSIVVAFDRHIRITFSELSRILHGSRSTLKSLDITEHQIPGSDLACLLESFGSHLTDLRTSSANQYSFSSLVRPIALYCPALRRLELGSYVEASQALEALKPLHELEEVVLKSVKAGQYEPTNLFGQVTDGIRAAGQGWSNLNRIEVIENVNGYGAAEGGRVREKEVSYRMRLDQAGSAKAGGVEVVVKVYW